MGKCIVKSCTVHSKTHNKQRGIHFYKVPRDRPIQEKWINIIRKLRRETDWLPTRNTTICSNHFRAEDVVTLAKCVRLKKDAIPILEEKNNQNSLSAMDTESNYTTDEEIQEILETPRKHEMRKVIERLGKTSENRLKRLKVLYSTNKRLLTKIKTLEIIIKDLKEKLLL